MIRLYPSLWTASEWLLGRMRTAFWKASGVMVGDKTRLSAISVTRPDQLRFGTHCALEPGLVFKFHGNAVEGRAMRIGDRVFVGRGCEFNLAVGIEIGDDTMIASNCRFIDHDHGFAFRSMPIAQQQATGAKIVIRDDVWLGCNVVVLKGVVIGRGAIVAAGAVVNKSIGEYEIWGGVPARKLAERP